MLDTDTKRRIDSARDLLVGKVPDPKSQVEQITIALIYKFMDDMDAEAEELGGKRKFFSGEYGKFGWAKLMQPGIGGHELLALYADGIAKMPENPGIPALFRDIFKNAYLPYRDPETLKSFLKVINEFSYDHSERLGDAFEYLLSVLGSQGDAGQFRTPRHIIDFIVEILAPRKEEVLLDPSCGTAGFLISAYKHILRSNTDAKGHNTLTPQQRGDMARNFKGYDISPDMVRLSLVNLYLHGFTDPHIFEYDTLTDTARWNEFADVILANPPFMSPKGGIRPHNRFSIQAKRSEVLFVDYIAEHLTPNGRAGIIVPEGIIFQSQNAYKDLRKMLVENSLVAVISLPAGCFNPYSGVKTSIFLLDKSLARQSDTVAFFKIENDGYDLGAQRRPIQKNDLPKVQEELETYLATLRERKDPSELSLTTALIVPKEKIAANGDYNLSGERYREINLSNASFPRVRLSDVCERIMDGTHFSPTSTEKGEYRYITAKNIKEWGIALDDVTYLSKKDHDEIYRRCPVKKGDVLYIKDGATTGIATINPLEEEFSLLSSVAVLRGKAGVLDNRFLVAYLNSPIGKQHMLGMMSGVAISRLTLTKLNNAEIPLPPLEIQREIVAEIEGYQKIINGARAVLENYRPHIPINPNWPMVELGGLIESKPKNGYSGKPVDHKTNLKVLTLSATTSGAMDLSKFKYLDEEIPLNAPCRCKRGDIYLQRGNTKELVGTAAIFDVDDDNYIYPDLMIRVRADESKIRSHYLLTVLQSQSVREFVTRNAVGAAGSMPKINQTIVESIPIPLPALAEQQAIVAAIEAEQALVNANRELITRFEAKIQTTLSRIWGEDSASTEA